jgi:hypothetical protein
MKGFSSTVMLAACAASLLTGVGCDFGNGSIYRDWVDPCYPERYNAMARHETVGAINAQVQNGHILDQTLWSCHFEPGSDKLTPGGIEKLIYLSRRRPCPDSVVFLETAQYPRDVGYDPAAPDKLATARAKLDNDRIAAIHRFLSVQTEGRPVAFQVVVHDPDPVDIAAVQAAQAIVRMYAGASGILAAGGR